MRFRLPEPPHGWRSFLNEITIVVLGVLIALAATELAQDYKDRRDVAHAESALKAEAYQLVQHMIERIAADQCQIDRINELRDKLQRSNGNWSADPVAWKSPDRPSAFPVVYRGSLRPWSRQAWAMAVSSGAVRHMDREDMAGFGVFYTQVERLARINDDEARLAMRLGPLAFDQQLDSRTIVEMQSILSELDYLNTRMSGGSRQMLERLREGRLGFSKQKLDADAAEIITGLRETRGHCVKDVRLTL